jgi:hypothetical protein
MTPWRTATVVGLCEGMREAQDFSAAPILADALEDADYPDAEMLKKLRGALQPWEAERLVALVYSDESAAAVAWMDAFAGELGEGGYPGGLPAMTYARLIEAAREFAATGSDGLGGGSMNWSNEICDRESEFWASYRLVTGAPPPGDTGWFLACTC